MFIGELAHTRIHPTDGPLQHLERLLVAAKLIQVEQPGVDLVQGIPRNPDGLEGHHTVDQLLGKGAEITARKFGLTLGHAGNHPSRPFLELFIAAALIGQRATGQVMADRMAAHFARGSLPAAVGRG